MPTDQRSKATWKDCNFTKELLIYRTIANAYEGGRGGIEGGKGLRQADRETERDAGMHGGTDGDEIFTSCPGVAYILTFYLINYMLKTLSSSTPW